MRLVAISICRKCTLYAQLQHFKQHLRFVCLFKQNIARFAVIIKFYRSAIFNLQPQRRKVKDFFIKFTKKSHFEDFLTEQTLDFVLHRLFCGLAEMHTDDIGCLADLLSDSRASGGVGCGIVHSKSSCK